jgi:hypothetical protein
MQGVSCATAIRRLSCPHSGTGVLNELHVGHREVIITRLCTLWENGDCIIVQSWPAAAVRHTMQAGTDIIAAMRPSGLPALTCHRSLSSAALHGSVKCRFASEAPPSAYRLMRPILESGDRAVMLTDGSVSFQTGRMRVVRRVPPRPAASQWQPAERQGPLRLALGGCL